MRALRALGGVLLGLAALRLYGTGLRLMLPRGRDVEKVVRRRTRRWWKRHRPA